MQVSYVAPHRGRLTAIPSMREPWSVWRFLDARSQCIERHCRNAWRACDFRSRSPGVGIGGL